VAKLSTNKLILYKFFLPGVKAKNWLWVWFYAQFYHKKKDHTHSIASLLLALQVMELTRKHWLMPFSSADLV
jgi:hypothetical protein